MESPSNRAGEKRDTVSATQFRSKPFLTILDGKPSAKSRPRRPERRAEKLDSEERTFEERIFREDGIRRGRGQTSPAVRMKKSGTRFRSYAGEGFHSIVAGAISAGKTISLLPRSAFKAAAEHAAAWKTDRRRTSSIQSATESGQPASDLPAALSDDPSPGLFPERTTARLKSLSIPGFIKWFGKKAAALRPQGSRATRILLFAFIAVISLSAGAGVLIGATSFPVPADNLLLPDEESVQAALLAYLEPDTASPDDPPAGALPPVPVSVSMQPYTIRSGDTLERIAKRFGLRQDTIIAANNLQSAGSIHPGVKLRIPNMDGISHRVRSGDSLSSLSKSYAIDITRIVDANDLASGIINAGQNLFIPNARLSSASLRNFYGERFIWPARGPISSPFGYRANPFTGLRTYHSAMDIVVSLGTRVKATSAGTVADTGYNSVFGNYIILRHASGYQSLYGHLSSIAVKEGSSVAQGAVIGLSGNTGQSTGPHLHFSIFKNGQALDPLKYVK